MKLKLTVVFFLLVVFGYSQELKITPKKCIPKKGFYIRLKEVVEDSRCPQDVTCIWAGQAVVIVEVYENKKLIEEKTLYFDGKHTAENTQWFSKYNPDKKLKRIQLLPAPKDGVTIKFKKRYINLIFEE
jgi:hypothetical protein